MNRLIVISIIPFIVGCGGDFYKTSKFDMAEKEKVCLGQFQCQNPDVAASVQSIVETELLRGKKEVVNCEDATMVISGKIIWANYSNGGSNWIYSDVESGQVMDTLILEAHDKTGDLLCRFVKSNDSRQRDAAFAKQAGKDFADRIKK